MTNTAQRKIKVVSQSRRTAITLNIRLYEQNARARSRKWTVVTEKRVNILNWCQRQLIINSAIGNTTTITHSMKIYFYIYHLFKDCLKHNKAVFVRNENLFESYHEMTLFAVLEKSEYEREKVCVVIFNFLKLYKFTARLTLICTGKIKYRRYA